MTTELPELIGRALAGDRGSADSVVRQVMPIIQARVARTLVAWRGSARGRARQEVEDLSHEVFAQLLADGGRLLRAWSPERGSAAAYFAVVAHRRTLNLLNSRRRNMWSDEPTEAAELERAATLEGQGLEGIVASRELLGMLLARLREALTPRDWRLFELLYIEEVDDARARDALQLGRDALYQARRRLRGRVQTHARALAADIRAVEERP